MFQILFDKVCHNLFKPLLLFFTPGFWYRSWESPSTFSRLFITAWPSIGCWRSVGVPALAKAFMDKQRAAFSARHTFCEMHPH
jgi:hypothetical protein